MLSRLQPDHQPGDPHVHAVRRSIRHDACRILDFRYLVLGSGNQLGGGKGEIRSDGVRWESDRRSQVTCSVVVRSIGNTAATQSRPLHATSLAMEAGKKTSEKWRSRVCAGIGYQACPNILPTP